MSRSLLFFFIISILSVSSQTNKNGEYKTSDGKSFIDANQAKNHQNSIEADQLQKSILGNSQKEALEKEKQKQKYANDLASDARFRQQQKDEISLIAEEEFKKLRSGNALNTNNINKLTAVYGFYNRREQYIKGVCLLSVVKPMNLSYDFTDLVGNGSLFTSELTEKEKQLILKEMVKNSESVKVFATTDVGAEKVFDKYCSDTSSFTNEFLPKIMTYLKRRGQDHAYKATAYKVKCSAGIKWLNDNGVSREYDPFKELKENVKKKLQVNSYVTDYGKDVPKRLLEQIENSGYNTGSDQEMELLRGIAFHKIYKYPEAGKAFGTGWPYYQQHISELSLTYPIIAATCLAYDAKFKYAAEASLVYLRKFPQWNSLASYVAMLILDGQHEKAESEFKYWSKEVKLKGIKAASLGSEGGTEKLMEACISFYNKKYKKAYAIFKNNEWMERENYYYWIMYHIAAKKLGKDTPSLIVDITGCTKPDWIDEATWALGKRN